MQDVGSRHGVSNFLAFPVRIFPPIEKRGQLVLYEYSNMGPGLHLR